VLETRSSAIAEKPRFLISLNISLSRPRSLKLSWNDTLEYGVCKSLLVSQNAVPVSLEAGGDVPSRPNPSATLLVLRAMRENKIVICPFTVHVVSLNENNNDIFSAAKPILQSKYEILCGVCVGLAVLKKDCMALLRSHKYSHVVSVAYPWQTLTLTLGLLHSCSWKGG